MGKDPIKRSDKFLFDGEAIILPGEGAEFIPRYFSGKFDLHQRAYAIFAHKEKVFSPFLYQFLFANRDIFAQTAVGSTVKSLRLPIIQKVFVNIPSLPEQKKISEILSAIDEEIEKVDEIILKTEKLKKGLMRELLSRSENFKNVKFSELVKNGKNKVSPKEIKNQKYIGLEHIDQSSGLLLGFGNSAETQSIKSVFKKNDILFGKLRPYLRKYWKAEFDGVCTTEILVFTSIIKDDDDFIFQLIQTDEFIHHADSKSFGTKMPRTDWKIISNFIIKVPPPKERKRIAEILSSVDDKIIINKKLKNKLIRLKKGLMGDLLSGRVRVLCHFDRREKSLILGKKQRQ